MNLVKKNGDGIEENVQNWLGRVEKIEVVIQKWPERVRKIIGDDQEAGKIRKDEETAAAGEIEGDAERAAAAAGESREDVQAAAAAAREIGGGEETVAAAGEIGEGEEADEDKTAAKKGCFNGLCPNLESPVYLVKAQRRYWRMLSNTWKLGNLKNKFLPCHSQGSTAI